MSPKILGIKGSPRKRANSTTLLERLLAGAETEGAEVQTIVPWELRIEPCVACDGCFGSGRCIVKDDFQQVYDQILNCDALVLASPVYFGGVSAQVKPLIDRCESFWAMQFKLKAAMPPGPSGFQRKGILIATAGQNREIMFGGPRVTFGFLMHSLQGKVYAELLYGGLEEKGAIQENSSALERAYQVGQRLVLGLESENHTQKKDTDSRHENVDWTPCGG